MREQEHKYKHVHVHVHKNGDIEGKEREGKGMHGSVDRDVTMVLGWDIIRVTIIIGNYQGSLCLLLILFEVASSRDSVFDDFDLSAHD